MNKRATEKDKLDKEFPNIVGTVFISEVVFSETIPTSDCVPSRVKTYVKAVALPVATATSRSDIGSDMSTVPGLACAVEANNTQGSSGSNPPQLQIQ